MKTIRYTEAQIIAILRQAEGGAPVAEGGAKRQNGRIGSTNAPRYKLGNYPVNCPVEFSHANWF